MDILVVGGTPAHRGGVEQFCERATTALGAIGGHRIRHLHTHAAYLKLRDLPKLFGCAADLARARRAGFRHVWFQYVSLPDLMLVTCCRLLRMTVLVTPHLGSNWSSQSNPALRWLTARTLALAHGIGLISPTQAEEVALPAGPTRFALRTFLPDGFSSRNPELPAHLRLIHAGRLSDGKGTFLFLDVCESLVARGVGFEAKLIGSCDDATQARLRSRIDGPDLAGRVTLSGPILEPALMRELAAADVLIHLSRIDSFPLIVLEALGCGAFPICKDLPGARLMTQTYCGRVVEDAGAVDATAAILAATPLAEFRSSAEAASHRIAADYGWDSCAALVERAFEALAA